MLNLSHMNKYGIKSLTTAGPTLTRSLGRKELPGTDQQGFVVDSRLDTPSLKYVDRLLVQRTEDGWKPVTSLPENGVNRSQVAESYGVWQDAGRVRKGFPLLAGDKVVSKPDGTIQESEVKPFAYGQSDTGTSGPLLGAEILADAKEGSFSLRSSAQPESENFLQRVFNLGESSSRHHKELLADDQYWIVRA